MKLAQENEYNKFIPLKKAAQIIGVSIETLLKWNDLNILKPTITQSGEIGYLDQQITSFLALQGSIQNSTSIRTNSAQVKSEYLNTNPTPLSQNNQLAKADRKTVEKINNSTARDKSKISSAKLISISLVSFLVVVSITLFKPFVPNDGSEHNYYFQKDNTLSNTITKTSEDITITKTSVKNINPQSKTSPSFGDQLENLNNIKEVLTTNQNKKTAYANLQNSGDENSLADSNYLLQEHDGTIDINDITVTDLPDYTFASRPNTNSSTTNEDKLLLDNDQIDFLTTNFGSLVRPSKSSNKIFDLTILIITFSAIFFLATYHLNSLPAYSTTVSSTNRKVQREIIHNSLIEKVFEVHQKTDGTVIINNKHNQIKISKPELNSETDQLIQRILSCIGTNKEIHYDIVKDEKLNLNTPLSKVVTRLGFVGLKRDLFFPRTSKNKVIFRKYLTKNDLAIMNLKEEDILNEMTSLN